MVERRRLDPAFVDAAEAPERGERWIADTAVRGFGLRLWRSAGATRWAFALRRTDTEGRAVRRTFDPEREAPGDAVRWRLAELRRGCNDAAAFGGRPPPSLFLEPARRWARLEVANLKHGDAFTSQFGTQADDDDARRAARSRLGAMTLERCADLMLEFAPERGWSQAYADRLSTAFAWLPETLRRRSLGELSGEVFLEAFERTQMPESQRRLIRGLLGPAFANLRALGGPLLRFGDARSDHGRRRRARIVDHALDDLDAEDYARLLVAAAEMDFDWRGRIALQLCLRLPAPMSRILRGGWDDLRGSTWIVRPERPRSPLGTTTLDKEALELLGMAKAAAAREGVRSRFWFPAPGRPNKPYASLARAWRLARRSAGWPECSLRQVRAFESHPRWAWTSEEYVRILERPE
ncbi:MAG: hypothetical protein AAF192_17480 [Pseudomonadota bacterium]